MVKRVTRKQLCFYCHLYWKKWFFWKTQWLEGPKPIKVELPKIFLASRVKWFSALIPRIRWGLYILARWHRNVKATLMMWVPLDPDVFLNQFRELILHIFNYNNQISQIFSVRSLNKLLTISEHYIYDKNMSTTTYRSQKILNEVSIL